MRILKQNDHYPIPHEMMMSLQRYLSHGIMPGSFMTAVLENNLTRAFATADSFNTANMKNIVGYMYNEFPEAAWGSREKVEIYLESLEKSEQAS